MLFHYIYFLSVLFNASSFIVHKNADCNNCKWFFLPKGKREEYGLCKFFGKNDINNIINKTKVFQYEFAEHCRKNPFMCGDKGYLFEEKMPPIANKDDAIYKLETELYELKNKVYGEVNEKSDLDKTEEEIKFLMKKLFILKNSLENKNNESEKFISIDL